MKRKPTLEYFLTEINIFNIRLIVSFLFLISIFTVTGSNFEITFVSEKHVVEDDVLFTNRLVGK